MASTSSTHAAAAPTPDALLTSIADYATAVDYTAADRQTAFGDLALNTARATLADALGCGILALREPECLKLLGPVVPGAELSAGVPVPGTPHTLDPVTAAFNIGAMNRWLDYNDTWLAAEWGHPSDNAAAVLAAASWTSTQRLARGAAPLRMSDVLDAVVRAHEIQGVLALDNSFNRAGLDHVLLVRVASTAVATRLLGGDHAQVLAAVSNAFADGGALRTYRHFPNTGSRKSWAAGDAAARAVRLALLACTDEMGYPTVLTTDTWGFNDVAMNGAALTQAREFESYVIENVLWKVSAPAEFHAQTALEAAVTLHPRVADALRAGGVDAIDRIELTTQESAMRIISKTGPLRNPADRDHCLEYIVAVGLLKGELSATDYSDEAAADPRIDQLREKTHVFEDEQYSRDYLDPDKRSVANSVRVYFTDHTSTDKVVVEYPLGHRRRREEALPELRAKLRHNLATRYPTPRAERLTELCFDHQALNALDVPDFLAAWR